MDIEDLKIFVRLARVQNLSAVGSEFDLSAGTISKRLQALEAELSVRLFDRTTRAICITEEGETLLSSVERILDDLHMVFSDVAGHVTLPKGRLRLSAPMCLGNDVIGPPLCAFMRAYKDVELQVEHSDRFVGLADHGYDVAIRFGELEDSSMVAKRLTSDPQIIVAAPEYLAQRGVPTQPEDLSGHDCLMLGEGQHWRFSRGGVAKDVKVAGRMRSDSSDLLRFAALSGLGVLRISSNRVEADLRAGKLCLLFEDYDAGNSSAIWALYPSSRHMLPKLRVFLEFLAAWFRGAIVDEHAKSSFTTFKPPSCYASERVATKA